MANYLGSRNLNEDYGYAQPEQSPYLSAKLSPEAPAADTGAQQAAGGAAMSSGNPYAMAGGFLLNYLAAKQAAFEKKKQTEMQAVQNYANAQTDAVQSLNNNWKSALLRQEFTDGKNEIGFIKTEISNGRT